jgi:hypothetical protein
VTSFPLGIALQGFALTPIALAVQGLIAVLQEEEEKRQQVYGGKRKRQVRARPARQVESDEEIRRIVEDKWEAIEAADALDVQRKQAAKPAVPAKVVQVTPPAPDLPMRPTAMVQAPPVVTVPEVDHAVQRAAQMRSREIKNVTSMADLALHLSLLWSK